MPERTVTIRTLDDLKDLILECLDYEGRMCKWINGFGFRGAIYVHEALVDDSDDSGNVMIKLIGSDFVAVIDLTPDAAIFRICRDEYGCLELNRLTVYPEHLESASSEARRVTSELFYAWLGHVGQMS